MYYVALIIAIFLTSRTSPDNMYVFPHLEYDGMPCKVAGVVPRGSNPGQLDIDAHIPKADQRTMSMATCYSLVASAEALADAKWKPESDKQRQRTGCSAYYKFCSYEITILVKRYRIDFIPGDLEGAA